MIQREIISIHLILLFLHQISFGQSAAPNRYEFTSRHMGTQFRVILYSSTEEQAKEAAKAAFARASELDRIMTDYDAKSELMQLCKANDAEPNQPRTVSEDLWTVLYEAERISRLSDGAFDVSVGPVVRLWRLARRTQLLPPADELSDALKKVDYKQIVLSQQPRNVRLAQPGIRIDLGGIAKGYAADAMLRVLQQHQIEQALVAAAGDITCSKAPPGESGWKVEIAPLRKSEPKRVLLLANKSVSTSGDMEQFVEIAGVRYSHIVNPKTGIGLTGRRSVTVIAERGVDADALTKALSILPSNRVEAFTNAMPEIAVFIATMGTESAAVKTWQTANFAGFLQNSK